MRIKTFSIIWWWLVFRFHNVTTTINYLYTVSKKNRAVISVTTSSYLNAPHGLCLFQVFCKLPPRNWRLLHPTSVCFHPTKRVPAENGVVPNLAPQSHQSLTRYSERRSLPWVPYWLVWYAPLETFEHMGWTEIGWHERGADAVDLNIFASKWAVFPKGSCKSYQVMFCCCV